MRLEEILSSVTNNTHPTAISPALKALCLDKRDLWEAAHDAVHNEHDPISAAVHAYLHRKDGDIWNANYWYRNAGRKPFKGSLAAEWRSLVEEECARLGMSVEGLAEERSVLGLFKGT